MKTKPLKTKHNGNKEILLPGGQMRKEFMKKVMLSLGFKGW